MSLYALSASSLLGILLLLFLMPVPIFAEEPATRESLEEARLQEIGKFLQERSIRYEGESILVTIPGQATATVAEKTSEDGGNLMFPETFILALPLSKPGEQAEGLPYGIQAALRLIEQFQIQPPKQRVIIAFLGNEYPDSPVEEELHRGLRELYTTLDDPENFALVYLELFNPPQAISIHYGIGGKIAPLIMLRTLSQVLDKGTIPHSFAVLTGELYKLGLVKGPASLSFTLGRGLPSIMLQAPTVQSSDTPEKSQGKSPGNPEFPADPGAFATILADYAETLEWTVGGLDTHYSLIQQGSKTLFISEWGILLIILISLGISAGILLLYSAFYRHIAIPGWVDLFGNIAICAAILGLFWGVSIDINCAFAFMVVLFFASLGGVLPIPLGVFICAGFSFIGTIGTLIVIARYTPRSFLPILSPLFTLILFLPPLLISIRGWFLIHIKRNRASREDR